VRAPRETAALLVMSARQQWPLIKVVNDRLAKVHEWGIVKEKIGSIGVVVAQSGSRHEKGPLSSLAVNSARRGAANDKWNPTMIATERRQALVRIEVTAIAERIELHSAEQAAKAQRHVANRNVDNKLKTRTTASGATYGVDANLSLRNVDNIVYVGGNKRHNRDDLRHKRNDEQLRVRIERQAEQLQVCCVELEALKVQIEQTKEAITRRYDDRHVRDRSIKELVDRREEKPSVWQRTVKKGADQGAHQFMPCHREQGEGVSVIMQKRLARNFALALVFSLIVTITCSSLETTNDASASKAFRIKSHVEMANVNDLPVVVAGPKKDASKMISNSTFGTRLSAPHVDPAAPLATGGSNSNKKKKDKFIIGLRKATAIWAKPFMDGYRLYLYRNNGRLGPYSSHHPTTARR
jgi:hypothetical protein